MQSRASLSKHKRLSRWGRFKDVAYNSRESVLKQIKNRDSRSKRTNTALAGNSLSPNINDGIPNFSSSDSSESEDQLNEVNSSLERSKRSMTID
jgi:hypothetical protein